MPNVGRKHDSRWTSIYWDTDPMDNNKLKPYVRLTPSFMDLEAAKFPHGIGLAGFFDTEQKAITFAKRIDAFMDAMQGDLEDLSQEE